MWRMAGLGIALLITGVAVALLAGGVPWIKARSYIVLMERQDRLERMQVERVVQTLQLASGSVIADIGAGSGLFTRPLAKAVAPGVVYAVDINPNLLAHIEKSAKEAGLANIKTVLATEGDPRLPEALDVIFICDVLHLIEGPERYLRELHGYVRPGGRVAIISIIQNWPPVGNHFNADQLEKWMKQAGFALAERHDFITDQYLMIFERS